MALCKSSIIFGADLYTFKYSRVFFECYGTRQVIALSILPYCKTEFCFFAIFYIMIGT